MSGSNRSDDRNCGANGVTGACSEGESNGFLGLDLRINCWINRDGGGGGTCRKGDRFGGWCGGDTAVIDVEGGGAADGVVHRQGGGDVAAAAEEVAQGRLTVFRHAGLGNREADHGGGPDAGGEAGFTDLITETHPIEVRGVRLQVLEHRRGHELGARGLRRQGVEPGGLRQDGPAPDLKTADRIGIDGPSQAG